MTDDDKRDRACLYADRAAVRTATVIVYLFGAWALLLGCMLLMAFLKWVAVCP